MSLPISVLLDFLVKVRILGETSGKEDILRVGEHLALRKHGQNELTDTVCWKSPCLLFSTFTTCRLIILIVAFTLFSNMDSRSVLRDVSQNLKGTSTKMQLTAKD